MPARLRPSARYAVRRVATCELFRAFPFRAGLLAFLALLSGVLPAVFAALVGVLIGAMPGLVSAGFSSPAGHRVTVTLAAIALTLVVLELTGSAQDVATTDLYRRFDGYLAGRVMAAALAPSDLRVADDPALAASVDRAVRVARYGGGELVSGLSMQWTVRAQGLAAAVLVGYYWPAAAVVLTVVWVVLARSLRTSYYQANPFWTDPLRRARYIQRIGLLPHWAKEVRVFGLAGWLGEQFGRAWLQVMADLWRARRADRPKMAALGSVLLVSHLIVVLLLVRAATGGALTVAAVTVVLQGLAGMAMLAGLAGDTWIENGAVPVPDVLELERLVQGSGQDDPARTLGSRAPDSSGFGCIAFEGVSFGYPGAPGLVLRDLDLRIEAGTSLAIVGLNGAGKTTLVKLLTGLCQPTSGVVRIDGTDLAAIDQASWRRQIAVIFQEFLRYELPLRDNIGFGAVDQAADDRLVTEIAAQAGAASLVAGLPAGLDTTLSPRFDGGVDISGGQWQRVAFARALMAVRGGARVLVMDEPTAHLDVRAEAGLYSQFLDLTRGLTTIVISHRFSTVRRADRIVVLADGQIAEDGSHDELVTAGGQYARLFALQASSYRRRP